MATHRDMPPITQGGFISIDTPPVVRTLTRSAPGPAKGVPKMKRPSIASVMASRRLAAQIRQLSRRRVFTPEQAEAIRLAGENVVRQHALRRALSANISTAVDRLRKIRDMATTTPGIDPDLTLEQVSELLKLLNVTLPSDTDANNLNRTLTAILQVLKGSADEGTMPDPLANMVGSDATKSLSKTVSKPGQPRTDAEYRRDMIRKGLRPANIVPIG